MLVPDVVAVIEPPLITIALVLLISYVPKRTPSKGIGVLGLLTVNVSVVPPLRLISTVEFESTVVACALNDAPMPTKMANKGSKKLRKRRCRNGF